MTARMFQVTDEIGKTTKKIMEDMSALKDIRESTQISFPSQIEMEKIMESFNEFQLDDKDKVLQDLLKWAQIRSDVFAERDESLIQSIESYHRSFTDSLADEIQSMFNTIKSREGTFQSALSHINAIHFKLTQVFANAPKKVSSDNIEDSIPHLVIVEKNTNSDESGQIIKSLEEQLQQMEQREKFYLEIIGSAQQFARKIQTEVEILMDKERELSSKCKIAEETIKNKNNTLQSMESIIHGYRLADDFRQKVLNQRRIEKGTYEFFDASTMRVSILTEFMSEICDFVPTKIPFLTMDFFNMEIPPSIELFLSEDQKKKIFEEQLAIEDRKIVRISSQPSKEKLLSASSSASNIVVPSFIFSQGIGDSPPNSNNTIETPYKQSLFSILPPPKYEEPADIEKNPHSFNSRRNSVDDIDINSILTKDNYVEEYSFQNSIVHCDQFFIQSTNDPIPLELELDYCNSFHNSRNASSTNLLSVPKAISPQLSLDKLGSSANLLVIPEIPEISVIPNKIIYNDICTQFSSDISHPKIGIHHHDISTSPIFDDTKTNLPLLDILKTNTKDIESPNAFEKSIPNSLPFIPEENSINKVYYSKYSPRSEIPNPENKVEYIYQPKSPVNTTFSQPESVLSSRSSKSSRSNINNDIRAPRTSHFRGSAFRAYMNGGNYSFSSSYDNQQPNTIKHLNTIHEENKNKIRNDQRFGETKTSRINTSTFHQMTSEERHRALMAMEIENSRRSPRTINKNRLVIGDTSYRRPLEIKPLLPQKPRVMGGSDTKEILSLSIRPTQNRK